MAAEMPHGLGTLKSLSRVKAEPTAASARRICGTFTSVSGSTLPSVSISGGLWVAPADLNPSPGNQKVADFLFPLLAPVPGVRTLCPLFPPKQPPRHALGLARVLPFPLYITFSSPTTPCPVMWGSEQDPESRQGGLLPLGKWAAGDTHSQNRRAGSSSGRERPV